jgi:hypothetical protein
MGEGCGSVSGGPSGSSALVIVVCPSSSCPTWARMPLGIRAAATATGYCPGCGATVNVTGDPFDQAQAIGGMAHEPGCPAIDPRLAQLGPGDVELRALVVELDEEAAA